MMLRLFLIVMSGLLMSFLSFSATVSAGPSAAGDENGSYQLKEMVVTATRDASPADSIASTITVIDRSDLELLPAATVAEALRFVPGVYISFEGNGPGGYATAGIQGSEVRHVAVYADGVPLNLEANPLTHLSYLPVAAVERIEVYKGVASSAWGSSLGGVINIITRQPETEAPVSGEARVSLGEAQTVRGGGHIQRSSEDWGWLLALTSERSDGFEDHSEYDQQDGYARLDYHLNDAGRLSLACSRNDGHINDPVIGIPAFWDDMTHERSWQRLRYTGYPAGDGNLLVTLEGWHRRFEGLIEDVFADHREIYSDYEEDAWGGAARLTWQTASDRQTHQVTVGLDGENGDYAWQNYIQRHDTGHWAVYANDTCTMGPWSLNAGLRYDKDREFDPEVSPSLGVVYRLADHAALVRFQVAHGFSAPPSAWLNDPYGGNPDLDPETAWNWQLSTAIELLPFLRFELTGFYADVKDLIRGQWIDPVSHTWQYVNIDEVTRQGVEGGLFAEFDNGLRLSLTGCFTDVEDDTTGETVKDIPRLQYQAGAVYAGQWLAGQAMTHSLNGTWIDHNSSYPETRDRRFVFDYRFETGLPGLNRFGRPAAFVAVYNLFNTRYLYRNIWPRPGRWVEAGIKTTF